MLSVPLMERWLGGRGSWEGSSSLREMAARREKEKGGWRVRYVGEGAEE